MGLGEHFNVGDRFMATEHKPEHCSVPGCEEPCVELVAEADWEDGLKTLWLLYCETHMGLGLNEPLENHHVIEEGDNA